jgi:glycerol-3-phosphate dehydrogenase
VNRLSISVLGDGGGNDFGGLIVVKRIPVTLWGHLKITVKRCPDAYQPQCFRYKNPENIRITPIRLGGMRKDIIVLAAPSQYTRGVLRKIKGRFPRKAIFLSVTKGIELKTSMRISEIVHLRWGRKVRCFIRATIAQEVPGGYPRRL